MVLFGWTCDCLCEIVYTIHTRVFNCHNQSSYFLFNQFFFSFRASNGIAENELDSEEMLELRSNLSSTSLSQEAQCSFLVLNEVVVNRGSSHYLCNIDLYLEGRRITSVQGDGLIISTPTGSTAYAVAAGASIVHPNVPCIMITPICPHSLSFRPIIVPPGAELKFTVAEDARGTAAVCFDGRSSITIGRGDFVTVRTSVHPAPCICKANPFDDWFDSLSECLHWNSRQIQKKLELRNDYADTQWVVDLNKCDF